MKIVDFSVISKKFCTVLPIVFKRTNLKIKNTLTLTFNTNFHSFTISLH